MKKVTVASLFAGGGGWEVGAVMAGCKPIWASELQEDIAKVHDKALPGSHVYVGDITNLTPQEVQPVDVLCVSPPCQGYSVARLGRYRQVAGNREDMMVGLESLKFIEALMPPVVLMENVTAYAKSDVFQKIVGTLKTLGYHVDHRNVFGYDYGVPSSRHRLILRATLRPLPPWPEKTPRPSWSDALADLLPTLPNATGEIPAYMAKSLATTHPPKNADLLVWSGGALRKTASGDRVLWVQEGKPGPTVTATFKSIGSSFVLRPDGSRKKFTSRCAARIQSFPDWYPLPADNVLAFKVIGNAVPPALAQRVIESVLPVV